MKVIAASLVSFLSVGVMGLGSIATATDDFGDRTYEELVGGVLNHPSIRLLPGARRDVEAGLIDPRVLRILLILSERHELSAVGPLVSGHSYYVKGTDRPSNHVFGRAVDISVIDHELVSRSNFAAQLAVRSVLSLPAPPRPDEVGSPWEFSDPGAFHDANHRSHLHLGWRPAR